MNKTGLNKQIASEPFDSLEDTPQTIEIPFTFDDEEQKESKNSDAKPVKKPTPKRPQPSKDVMHVCGSTDHQRTLSFEYPLNKTYLRSYSSYASSCANSCASSHF